MRKTRRPAGRLDPAQTNSREAAILELAASNCACVEWDYSQDGGALGDINFGYVLPAGAIVTRITTDEITNATGATAVTVKAGSTSLTGAVDFTALSGAENQALAGAAARIKLAVDSELKMTIATNAATAGKVRILVEFIVSK
jgi:hypothetical protein